MRNARLDELQAGIKRGGRTTLNNFRYADDTTLMADSEEELEQIANIGWIIEKAREFQKNIYLCSVDYSKAFVWIMTNCGKLLERWEYQTILPVS